MSRLFRVDTPRDPVASTVVASENQIYAADTWSRAYACTSRVTTDFSLHGDITRTDDLTPMVHASREHSCSIICNKGLTCGYCHGRDGQARGSRASQRREWRHARQTVPRPRARRRARRHGDRTHVPRPMLGRRHAQYGELVSWHRRLLLSSGLPLRAGRCRGRCRGHFGAQAGAQATRGDYIVEGHRRRRL